MTRQPIREALQPNLVARSGVDSSDTEWRVVFGHLGPR